jgi:hypothetical protein
MGVRVLGQSAPSATTNTDILQVSNGIEVVISTIFICNRAAAPATYRIAVRPGAITLADATYIAYDVTVGASDTTTITAGITLKAFDVVTVYASTANLSFNIFGSETIVPVTGGGGGGGGSDLRLKSEILPLETSWTTD